LKAAATSAPTYIITAIQSRNTTLDYFWNEETRLSDS